MNKAKIIYVQDSQGNRPALDVIYQIAQRANSRDDLSIRLIQLIRLGLRDIEKYGVIEWDKFKEYQLVTTSTRGFRVTFNLVKRLHFNKPLFEFRINQKRFPNDPKEKGYAFRMIFFTYEYQGIQYIVCTNSLIKRARTDDRFEQMILEALQIYRDCIKNPLFYLEGMI